MGRRYELGIRLILKEGEFLHHAPCPKCGSKDNLGVYSDHVYCFGCRYYHQTTDIPVAFIREFKKRLVGTNKDWKQQLPEDFSRDIPKEGLAWLNQYGITAKDILVNHIGWSANGVTIKKGTTNEFVFAPCMVFPVYDVYGNLLLWQGRYFGTQEKSRRYLTFGARDVIHTIGEGSPIILVEDLLSAIKVGRASTAVPLFGSSVNIDLLVRLHRICNSILLWLDRDKTDEAYRVANRARQFFKDVRVISTELDPKCYSTGEIKSILADGNISTNSPEEIRKILG